MIVKCSGKCESFYNILELYQKKGKYYCTKCVIEKGEPKLSNTTKTQHKLNSGSDLDEEKTI